MICTMYAPWFGELPFYTNKFLICCEKAKNIQWCISSDQPAPNCLPENIFWQVVDSNLKIKNVFPSAPSRFWGHKLCDLKPFWNLIFFDYRCKKTEYFGWIDWDVYHDLSLLEFCFESAKFTKGSLCSPLFITRHDVQLLVWPSNLDDLLKQNNASSWDENFYLKNINSTILQSGMTPEVDLFCRAKFAVHMFKAKHCPVMYDRWLNDYFG